jgi:hypothetical protein
VNNLPWEVDAIITVFISSMESLEKDLRDKDISRELSTLDSAGKPIRAFEYLWTYSAKVKQLKLERKGSDGSVVQQVNYYLPRFTPHAAPRLTPHLTAVITTGRSRQEL